MATRRSRGEGGIHWDESRNRWIATASLGFDGRGKRITKKASGQTKTEAREKLREILRDHQDGISQGDHNYTVEDAVTYWLAYGTAKAAPSTIENYTHLARQHILPSLGAFKLRHFSAEDVDKWLKVKSKEVSTRTLRLLHSILNRSIKKAQARDKVKRNVVMLCEIPEGRPGRPSKSLDLPQAEAVLSASTGSSLCAYIVLSLLIGARTEELRALTWGDVDLTGSPESVPPVPPSISVVRSVRAGGETKTRKSRRRLAMPSRCASALSSHLARLDSAPSAADLVFPSKAGTPLDAHNVRREFRNVLKSAGIESTEWTPRELRHSFVSLLSDDGMPWSTYLDWWGTAGRRSLRLYIGIRSAPSLRPAPKQWIASFPVPRPGEAASPIAPW